MFIYLQNYLFYLFNKLAVTIAVIHMLFGVILKGVNSIFFNNYVDFFFEFIP